MATKKKVEADAFRNSEAFVEAQKLIDELIDSDPQLKDSKQSLRYSSKPQDTAVQTTLQIYRQHLHK